jgi:hypothetical protein
LNAKHLDRGSKIHLNNIEKIKEDWARAVRTKTVDKEDERKFSTNPSVHKLSKELHIRVE